MDIVLFAGEFHRSLLNDFPKKLHIINEESKVYLDCDDFHEEGFDRLVVVDHVLGANPDFKRKKLEGLLHSYRHGGRDVEMTLLTTDFVLYLTLVSNAMKGFDVTYAEAIPSASRIMMALELASDALPQEKRPHRKEKAIEKAEEKAHRAKKPKRNFLNLFTKPEHKESTVSEGRAVFSRGVRKSILVTGGRNTGISSTTVNLAAQLAKSGFKTIIVDLDTRMRTMNAYFDGFHDAACASAEMEASLIRLLANPGDYSIYTYQAEKNLWVTALGYHFSDRQLEERFLTPSYIIPMLTLLKNDFNVILMDAPFEEAVKYGELLGHVDVVGICLENSLHSILSTVRHLDTYFREEQVRYLNAKGKLILNRFNPANQYDGEQLYSEKVAEIMASGLSPSLTRKMQVVGAVPERPVFSKEIETDQPAVTRDKEISDLYDQILMRMIEGI